jgi:hypothetical protein
LPPQGQLQVESSTVWSILLGEAFASRETGESTQSCPKIVVDGKSASLDAQVKLVWLMRTLLACRS